MAEPPDPSELEAAWSSASAAWTAAEAAFRVIPWTVAASFSTVVVAFLAVFIPYWQRAVAVRDARLAKADRLLSCAAANKLVLRQVREAFEGFKTRFMGPLQNIDDDVAIDRQRRALEIAQATLQHYLDQGISDLALLQFTIQTLQFVRDLLARLDLMAKASGLDRWREVSEGAQRWARVENEVTNLETQVNECHKLWFAKAKR